jgi:ankyrin repeat protein
VRCPIDYPLHRAIFDGDIDQIKLLIQTGEDVNIEDDHGMTSLYTRKM